MVSTTLGHRELQVSRSSAEKAAACTPPPGSSSASRAARGRASRPRRGRWRARSRSAGYAALLTFEPGDTPVGKELRRIVLDPGHRRAVPPHRGAALRRRQGRARRHRRAPRARARRGRDHRPLRRLHARLPGGRPRPRRRRGRAGRALGDPRPAAPPDRRPRPRPASTGWAGSRGATGSRGSRSEFFQRVREAFLALAAADPDHYLVLDAGRPADEIAAASRDRGRAAARAGGADDRRACGDRRPHAHGVWDSLVGPAPRDRGAARRGGRPRHEPRLAVHRAAGLRPLQRRDRVRRRAPVRAAAAPAAGSATRATPCSPAPTPTSP